MEFLKVASIKDAVNQLCEKTYEFDTEIVEIDDLNGRILSKNYFSKINLPPFCRSSVDGYAVISSDTFGADDSIPSLLTFIGSGEMGKPNEFVVSMGQAVYVPTGGMLPQGADAVVMIEYCENVTGDMLTVLKAVTGGENVILVGEDVTEGELIAKKGTVSDFRTIATLSSCGISEAEAYKKPKITIISTGDELVSPQGKLSSGQIYDSNTYSVKALCEDACCEVIACLKIKDDFILLKKAIEDSVAKSDMVLLSGGSSAGEKDYTVKIIESIEDGFVLTHGLSVKPGKPTIIGTVSHKPVIGLPGHPSAAMMIFTEVFWRFLRKKRNETDNAIKIFAKTSENIHSAPGKSTFQLAFLEYKNGEYIAHPMHSKSSHIKVINEANGYIEIPTTSEGIEEGQTVEVKLF